MVQLSSDLARQRELMNASLSARREGAEFLHSPLYQRLAEMREKEERKRNRRRIPWGTILILAVVVPFFWGSDNDKDSKKSKSQGDGLVLEEPVIDGAAGDATAEDAQVDEMLSEGVAEEKATVSVTIGGKTVSKELSISEIRNMQMMPETLD